MNAGARVVRTVLQVLVGLGAGIPAVAANFNLSAAQAAKIGGWVAGAVVLVTVVQNALEGWTVPTLLAPKPEQPPQSTTAP